MSDLEGGGAEKALVELLKSIDYTRYKVSLCLILPRGVYMEDIPKEVNIITLFEGKIQSAIVSYLELILILSVLFHYLIFCTQNFVD